MNLLSFRTFPQLIPESVGWQFVPNNSGKHGQRKSEKDQGRRSR